LNDVEVVTTEHHGKCFGGLLLNGEGVGLQTVDLAGFDRLADVTDAIGSLIAIVVTGSSIRDENDDFP